MLPLLLMLLGEELGRNVVRKEQTSRNAADSASGVEEDEDEDVEVEELRKRREREFPISARPCEFLDPTATLMICWRCCCCCILNQFEKLLISLSTFSWFLSSMGLLQHLGQTLVALQLLSSKVQSLRMC